MLEKSFLCNPCSPRIRNKNNGFLFSNLQTCSFPPLETRRPCFGLRSDTDDTPCSCTANRPIPFESNPSLCREHDVRTLSCKTANQPKQSKSANKLTQCSSCSQTFPRTASTFSTQARSREKLPNTVWSFSDFEEQEREALECHHPPCEGGKKREQK